MSAAEAIEQCSCSFNVERFESLCKTPINRQEPCFRQLRFAKLMGVTSETRRGAQLPRQRPLLVGQVDYLLVKAFDRFVFF